MRTPLVGFETASVPLLVLQVIALFLASTVVFDVVHYLLHVCADSRFALLRRIGGLHAAHHAFLDRRLRIHDEYRRANLRRHVIPEFLTQASFSGVLLWVLPPAPVLAVLALQAAVFLGILACRGKDVNHRAIARLRAYRPTCFCLPPYHALHHVTPDAHFSSWIKLFDQLIGTGVSFHGRRVAIAGAETGFGAALLARLRRRGVEPIASVDPGGGGLRDVDILILARGGSESEPGSDAAVAEIEAFVESARDRLVPVEVWSVGSRGGAFARHARRYYVDDRVIYRHIALAPSRVEPGGGPGRAARIALFFIRRGFHYVPSALDASALLDFVSFRYFLRPAFAPADLTRARTSAGVSRGRS